LAKPRAIPQKPWTGRMTVQENVRIPKTAILCIFSRDLAYAPLLGNYFKHILEMLIIQFYIPEPKEPLPMERTLPPLEKTVCSISQQRIIWSKP
ncbi:hypothetical protein, partial [uncultured Bifidobacterium sp.]|uniref:hypothetical protein n=1 Tax=uncultured Bifidobacterium sp. TaxID=165187 RepID=UPI00258D0550